ncbi:polyhydroxyalkanoate depolymerase [Nannocystis punicea]|uniref:Polyhydroxyalkanoate depolymerase n=1 Tax=Nannocystis punicea TaxID=2995304 RepID=A0ABY7H699_9BACT|nr:polyhydroxyalkanoate depolymerase [Nannocystis poenicansa]WAS94549.1 polyhydroxyalkanoate depolymerase [Nannocystis poenicansa]
MLRSCMLYELHDLQRRWLRPIAGLSRMNADLLRMAPGGLGRPAAAGWELLRRITKDHPRPVFGIDSVVAHGQTVAIREEVVMVTPWCRLVRFARRSDDAAVSSALARDPRVLLCAPLSGHFATLLRDTVRSLAAEHDVYVTDWSDAREVPLADGFFGLDDYVLHLERFLRALGPARTHMIAVCQPAVPALAAVARMASAGQETPASLVLMGGPIDGRRSPTQVNRLATERPLVWFEKNLVHRVPAGFPGEGRRVYPGFLQLAAFVSMNPRRHFTAYRDYWLDRVRGRDDKAAAHERFYDEYNAVLDMDALYYLETVRLVFQEHALARGRWTVAGELVRPGDIRTTALLTVEGAEDDITGAGQTHAALDLCTGLRDKQRFTAEGVGHYGIFSGERWRRSVYPTVRDFVRAHDPAITRGQLP